MKNNQDTIEQRLKRLIEQYKDETEALSKILSSISQTKPIVSNNESQNKHATDSTIIKSTNNQQKGTN